MDSLIAYAVDHLLQTIVFIGLVLGFGALYLTSMPRTKKKAEAKAVMTMHMERENKHDKPENHS